MRDFDGDGRADLVVGSGAGTFVRTYSGAGLVGNMDPSPSEWFEAYPGVTTGVFVG